MRITITGTAGSGKSTLGKLLAEQLGSKHISIGKIRRQMAKEKGMTLEEFNKLGETEEWTDKRADEKLIQFAEENENCVVDGRMAPYLVKDSIKIFVTADLDVRAQRIFDENRAEETTKTKEQMMTEITAREKHDDMRYKKIYNIDPLQPEDFDIIIDTTHKTPEEEVKEVLENIKTLKHNL